MTREQLDSLPFLDVDKNPEFKGGQDSLYKFITRNFKYPCSDVCIQGTIFVDLIVEKNGDVTNVKIKKGVQHLFDQEALRVIKLLPAWLPGQKNGKAVRTIQVIPIKVKI
jgi:periplasmic protein TonB